MVEHAAVNRVVVGSSPTSGANFSEEIEDFENHRTNPAQNPPDLERPRVRFPKVIRFRREEATIYGKKPKYPYYRIAYYVAGKRIVRSIKSYAEAKTAAEKVVRDVAEGSQAAALNAEQ